MALLYGVVKTGFAEELLFRGLIAGSLGRRLPLVWANLLQALIFLLPHGVVSVSSSAAFCASSCASRSITSSSSASPSPGAS